MISGYSRWTRAAREKEMGQSQALCRVRIASTESLLEKLPWLVSFSTFSNISRQNSFRVTRTHSTKFARGSTQVADQNRQGTPQDCQSFFRPSASGTPRESYGYPLLCARQRPNPAGHDLITATESITPTTTISWACEPIIQIGKGHLMRKPSPLM